MELVISTHGGVDEMVSEREARYSWIDPERRSCLVAVWIAVVRCSAVGEALAEE